MYSHRCFIVQEEQIGWYSHDGEIGIDRTHWAAQLKDQRMQLFWHRRKWSWNTATKHKHHGLRQTVRGRSGESHRTQSGNVGPRPIPQKQIAVFAVGRFDIHQYLQINVWVYFIKYNITKYRKAIKDVHFGINKPDGHQIIWLYCSLLIFFQRTIRYHLAVAAAVCMLSHDRVQAR